MKGLAGLCGASRARRTATATLASLLLLHIVSDESAAYAAPDTCGAESNKQGYWWKCEPETADEEEIIVDESFRPLGPPPDEETLLAMHPEQVEVLIEDYRENAVWQSTPETVTWYYQLQDFARRRAKAFTAITEMVMLRNPDLNMQTQYPTNNTGMAVRNEQRAASINGRLAQERDKAALVLLKRETCPYCVPARAALRHFQSRHGWRFTEIDLDENPQAVARFGTNHTPTTVVIFRGTDEWMPVAVGVESVPRIEESVYRAIRLMRGETSPEQFILQDYQHGTALDPSRANERSVR